MSKILPEAVLSVFRSFNDLTIDLVGVSCTVYIPTNLTALETEDMYVAPTDITYREHINQQLWIEWAPKDLYRLRKIGVFKEDELPIIGWFKLVPEVTIGSYIKVESKYIPSTFDTDEFQVADVIMKNFYDSEIYRCFKLSPRRAKAVT